MKHYVYVLSKYSKPLMPTTKFRKVRRMLKEGKARVIKSKSFTIQLQYEFNTYTQSLNLGVDPGRNHIGASVKGGTAQKC